MIRRWAVRACLILLGGLPACALGMGDVAPAYVLATLWLVVILPASMLLAIDVLRGDASGGGLAPVEQWGLRLLVLATGAISGLMGAGIVVWCLYNVFVRRLPDYSGPRDPLALFLGGFGVAPAMIGFGGWAIRLATGRLRPAS